MGREKAEGTTSSTPPTRGGQACSNESGRRSLADRESPLCTERPEKPKRMTQRPKCKRDIDRHADDADLFSSMSRGSLNEIISKHKYLYSIPLFWTHRHEKLLHVDWRPFQPASSSPVPLVQRSLHAKQQRRKQRRRQQNTSVQAKELPKPQPVFMKRNRSRSLLRLLLSSPQPLLPSPSLSFELIENHSSVVAHNIACLEDGSPRRPLARQQIVQFLLSAVDKSDTAKIFDRIRPCQKYLRLDNENISIYFGQRKHTFLSGVPVYRLKTKRNKHYGTDYGDENFWRMLHLDYTHIKDALRQNKRYGSNYRKYGVRIRGMTMEECTVRYNYEQGDDKWSHPHFIPGVFIAMEQRYWNGWWRGQKLQKSREKDTRRDEREDPKKRKCNNKHENETSSGKAQKTSEAKSVTVNRVAPTWQILVTDGPNDGTYAHLYTTRVPMFFIKSLDKPAQCQFRDPPASTEHSGVTKHDKGCKHGDVPFKFAIRHTMIAYKPYDSFRERLREAIVSSRDNLRGAGRDARRSEYLEAK
ncbi:hypothetical protein F5X98DRAFT_99876 [Xylaria grammica]|nr:hypothetical protein F5X98DRAFT_99876 [Xylaria grammica]